MLKPFVEAGKPVFHVEYTNSRAEFCATTEALGFQSIRKGPNFGLRPKPVQALLLSDGACLKRARGPAPARSDRRRDP